MRHYTRRLIQSAITAGLFFGLAGGPALAQTDKFPERAVSIYVPFGPGSGSDVYARYFGEKLSERLGQPVVVENKPGAGGAIATQALKSDKADGHTILLGSNSPMAANVSVYKSLPYDPVKDVVPISGLTRSMAVIIVPNDSPIKSIEDLVTRGKEEPQLNMGTYSAGYQLAVAPFLKDAGFTWQDIPYKGLAQATTDLIGGQIDVAVLDSPGTTNTVKIGQARALAVTGKSRHPELHEVPTLHELGYEDAVHYNWTALWVHADTDPKVIDVLSSNMLEILNSPESAEFVAQSSGEIMPLSPEEMRKFQITEIKRFKDAVEILDFEKI